MTCKKCGRPTTGGRCTYCRWLYEQKRRAAHKQREEQLCPKTLDSCLTLDDYLTMLDRIQGRRFGRLPPRAREIAEAGIIRHLDACKRHNVEPDVSAVREIIDDALEGRAVYLENPV